MTQSQQTDIEKFIELYRSFGIECKENVSDSGDRFIVLCAGDEWTPAEEGETRSDKLDGYVGFYTLITFDADGKFKGQGFRE